MLISRRSTLAYASAFAAVSASNAGASILPLRQFGQSQRIQHLLVHPDEAGGRMVCAALALKAPNTAWRTAGRLSEQDLHDTTASLLRRGYGLRRVNAFQTHRGVRYAAIWQFGRAAPAHVQTAMDVATFDEKAGQLARSGLAISQIDAARSEAGIRYSAIWERMAGTRQTVFSNLSEADLTQQIATSGAEGLVPRLIAGFSSGGGARFAAVFEAGANIQADLALAASHYPSRNRAMNAAGFELRDASGYAVSGQPFMTAVWERV